VLAAKIIRSLKQSPRIEGNRGPIRNGDFSMRSFYRQQLGQHYWDNLYNAPESLAYIFCDALPVEERTSTVIISVLLAQLCRQSSELLDAVTMRMEKSIHAPASYEDLVAVFVEDTTKILARYFLIVDGLDRTAGCAKFLLNLTATRHNSPKILILSRPVPMIIEELNLYPTFEITAAQVSEDIKLVLPSYLRNVISAFKVADRPGITPNIEEIFLRGNNGSFLWCKVLAKHLEYQVSPLNTLMTLSCIPTNIFDLYAQIFSCLKSEPDTSRIDIAVRSLKWLAVAQRPLDISELKIALSIEEDQTNFQQEQPQFPLEDLILSLCGPLVDIYRDTVHGSIMSVFCTSITLIHPTLEDFLFSSSETAIALGLPLSRPLLHIDAARVCLNYLSLPELANTRPKHQFQRGSTSGFRPPVDGFMSYAAVYVFEHTVYSGKTGAEDLCLLKDLLRFITTPLQAQSWTKFIAANNSLARPISNKEISEGIYNSDMWHPGMGKRIRDWLEMLNSEEGAFIKKLFTSWLNTLFNEI